MKDRKVRYFLTVKEDTLCKVITVPDIATDKEIDEIILSEVAATVKTNKWSVEWEEVQ